MSDAPEQPARAARDGVEIERSPATRDGTSSRVEGISLILEEEPDLAHGLSPSDRAAAVAAFRAPVISVSRPSWEPSDYDPANTYGLLVLDGLLGRRVSIGSAVGTELLGCGDILRPWDDPMLWAIIPPTLDWQVFRPTRLAILDRRITTLIGRRPELVINFSGRLLRRARSVAYVLTINHHTRVEDKLLVTLWHLASSFGRVTAGGIVIPFRLSHEVLGEILGAQRPSVTTAMRRLTDSQQVKRGPDGSYILLSDPPDWSQTAQRGMATEPAAAG